MGFVWNILSVTHLHMGNLNRLLNDSLAKFQNKTISNVKLQKSIEFFIAEHRRMSLLVLKNDYFLWSNILAAFLVSNAPINVYLVTFIFYKSTQIDSSLAIMSIVLLAQLAAIILGLYPTTIVSRRFHATSCILPQVQIQQDGSGFRVTSLKLKTLSFYEFLNSSRKITLSVGPFGQLTRRNMFEVAYQNCKIAFFKIYF